MEEKLGGYAGKFLRVDLTSNRIATEPLSRDLCENYIGGRGISGKIIFPSRILEFSPNF